MKQFKRGYRRCNDCHIDMRLESEEAARENGRTEPQLVCSSCGLTVPWAEIVDKVCFCGATPVQREYARSAPERGLRLYVTELSKLPMYHHDGRGLEAREACTACTLCFVCKQPVDTQECAWDEIPLEGMEKQKGLTHQYVYLHPGCFSSYEEWHTAYMERIHAQEAERERAAQRREYCIAQALCLECEQPLSLLDRFTGRLRHYTCSIKTRPDDPAQKAKRVKKAAKRKR